MANIIDIEGIGKVYATKLVAAGIRTTDALLRVGASRSGRADLAARTGVDSGKVLEWVNHADLMRIRGIGPEFSDLLEAAGVDSVKELGRRRSDNLHARMLEVNAVKKLVRRVPTLKDIDTWISEAKTLPAVVTH